MKKTCSNQKNSADNNANQQQIQPNEACHTVYDKNCKTVYRPHRSKVRKILAIFFFYDFSQIIRKEGRLWSFFMDGPKNNIPYFLK